MCDKTLRDNTMTKAALPTAAAGAPERWRLASREPHAQESLRDSASEQVNSKPCFCASTSEHKTISVEVKSGSQINLIKKSAADYFGLDVVDDFEFSEYLLDDDVLLSSLVDQTQIVGLTCFIFLFEGYELLFDGVVVRDDYLVDTPVDVVGGAPFMEQNDISVRPSKKQIMFGEHATCSYGSPSPWDLDSSLACLHGMEEVNDGDSRWLTSDSQHDCGEDLGECEMNVTGCNEDDSRWLTSDSQHDCGEDLTGECEMNVTGCNEDDTRWLTSDSQHDCEDLRGECEMNVTGSNEDDTRWLTSDSQHDCGEDLTGECEMNVTGSNEDDSRMVTSDGQHDCGEDLRGIHEMNVTGCNEDLIDGGDEIMDENGKDFDEEYAVNVDYRKGIEDAKEVITDCVKCNQGLNENDTRSQPLVLLDFAAVYIPADVEIGVLQSPLPGVDFSPRSSMAVKSSLQAAVLDTDSQFLGSEDHSSSIDYDTSMLLDAATVMSDIMPVDGCVDSNQTMDDTCRSFLDSCWSSHNDGTTHFKEAQTDSQIPDCTGSSHTGRDKMTFTPPAPCPSYGNSDSGSSTLPVTPPLQQMYRMIAEMPRYPAHETVPTGRLDNCPNLASWPLAGSQLSRSPWTDIAPHIRPPDQPRSNSPTPMEHVPIQISLTMGSTVLVSWPTGFTARPLQRPWPIQMTMYAASSSTIYVPGPFGLLHLQTVSRCSSVSQPARLIIQG